ncbi:hypothetical protein [Stenotrophomonas pigmentata]|uniref:hypothetical protein n=1 Tax=Stenotrophomonas pigmentata TaxID=3055080 RepID=UPI0026EFE82F|nr:hypothetical protein [Stenotrophomonas sp. 610A2]
MTSTQQGAELHRRIWQIANDVHGAVDGWDFKQCGPAQDEPVEPAASQQEAGRFPEDRDVC